MLTRRKWSSKNERGAVAAEFALLLPVFLVLMFAIIEFGVAFNRSQAIQGAAREGARVLSIPTVTSGDACARAIDTLGTVSFASPPTCATSGSCANAATERITVTVTGVTDIQIPFWPGSNSYTMTGIGEFRCE